MTDFLDKFFSVNIFSPILLSFIVLVIFDILTGVAKAISQGVLNSTIGRKGLTSHVMNILLVLVLFFVAEPLGLGWVDDTLIVFYALFYLSSIIENLSEIGVPFPKSVGKFFDRL